MPKGVHGNNNAPAQLRKQRAIAPKPLKKKIKTMTVEEEETKREAGRPSLYRPEYDKVAHNMCLLMEADDSHLAAVFECSVETVNRWKKEHPTFRMSIHEGKHHAVAKVAASLFNMATGYEYDDTEVKVLTVSRDRQEVERVTVRRFQPANVAAASLILRNKARDFWNRDAANVATASPQDAARAAREAIAAADATTD